MKKSKRSVSRSYSPELTLPYSSFQNLKRKMREHEEVMEQKKVKYDILPQSVSPPPIDDVEKLNEQSSEKIPDDIMKQISMSLTEYKNYIKYDRTIDKMKGYHSWFTFNGVTLCDCGSIYLNKSKSTNLNMDVDVPNNGCNDTYWNLSLKN